MQNLIDFHKEFSLHMCRELGFDEAIQHLFSFLLRYIPSDRVCYYSVERKTKCMNIMIDYITKRNHPCAQRIKTIFPWEKLFGWYGSNTAYINILSEDRESFDYIRVGFGATYQTSLSLLIDADQVNDRLQAMIFLSQTPHAYTERHRKLLESCYDIFRELLVPYFQNPNEDSCMILTESGLRGSSPESLLRRCPGLTRTMRQVDIVAPHDSTVLLNGASGSGKELLAETIHALSPRSVGPLIKVNCGAIPPTLLDSELFGHEKGAFTGASSSHAGYFEQARGGTLYLDEIGELELSAQVRLLRVLETLEIRRVGGIRDISVDVRIIAATHRDLEDMVRKGRFREDLWFRLCVYPIEIPPLEERLADIPVLASHFHAFYARKMRLDTPPVLTSRFLHELAARPWPGNVRQLRYVIERAMLESSALELPELRLAFRDMLPAAAPRRRRHAMSREEMMDALRRSNGKIQGQGGAAEFLGLSPSTLRSRMKAQGLSRPTVAGHD